MATKNNEGIKQYYFTKIEELQVNIVLGFQLEIIFMFVLFINNSVKDLLAPCA